MVWHGVALSIQCYVVWSDMAWSGEYGVTWSRMFGMVLNGLTWHGLGSGSVMCPVLVMLWRKVVSDVWHGVERFVMVWSGVASPEVSGVG